MQPDEAWCSAAFGVITGSAMQLCLLGHKERGHVRLALSPVILPLGLQLALATGEREPPCHPLALAFWHQGMDSFRRRGGNLSFLLVRSATQPSLALRLTTHFIFLASTRSPLRIRASLSGSSYIAACCPAPDCCGLSPARSCSRKVYGALMIQE